MIRECGVCVYTSIECGYVMALPIHLGAWSLALMAAF